MLPEEQEEHKTYLLKRKHYLMKIIDESSSDLSVADKVIIQSSCFVQFLSKAEKTTVPSDDPPSDDVIIVDELIPTPEQRALAGFLKLPSTFFCYKNKPGYVPEEDEDEDYEDYETAVKKLNGRLYSSDQKGKWKLQVGITGKTALESEHAITTLENQPTPGEKATGQTLQVPSTSASGINSNAEDGRPEDTQTEVKIQNMKLLQQEEALKEREASLDKLKELNDEILQKKYLNEQIRTVEARFSYLEVSFSLICTCFLLR
ncbi:E3 SUMO-protein ligase RanBP2-like [Numida meleagris]|uniref:E3 SUMO-protein ligase RanBP2-like n=1 Tax=Numida meleagris TaxID=8996 RepID=UPI000B3D9E06|nr:E3 SUMO-protein ligase RanBP2-like [Numida meleagris]